MKWFIGVLAVMLISAMSALYVGSWIEDREEIAREEGRQEERQRIEAEQRAEQERLEQGELRLQAANAIASELDQYDQEIANLERAMAELLEQREFNLAIIAEIESVIAALNMPETDPSIIAAQQNLSPEEAENMEAERAQQVEELNLRISDLQLENRELLNQLDSIQEQIAFTIQNRNQVEAEAEAAAMAQAQAAAEVQYAQAAPPSSSSLFGVDVEGFVTRYYPFLLLLVLVLAGWLSIRVSRINRAKADSLARLAGGLESELLNRSRAEA